MLTRTAFSLLAIVIMAAPSQGSIGQLDIPVGTVLHIGPGARAAGLGDCFVSIADDASACSWNPGGLAFIDGKTSLVGMWSQLVPDWGDVYYWYAAGAHHVTPTGVLAASLTYLTYGEQQGMTAEGEPTEVFSASELVPSLAYGLRLGESVGVGLNLKYVRANGFWLGTPGAASEAHNGSTWAADLGLLYRLDHRVGSSQAVLRAGVAGRHLGPHYSFEGVQDRDAFELPKSITAGASYRVALAAPFAALACFEYSRSVADYGGLVFQPSDYVLSGGVEFQTSITALTSRSSADSPARVSDRVTARVGYVYDPDGSVEDVSYGFGLRVDIPDAGSLSLDVASIPQAEGLRRPWRIGLSGSFGL